MQLWQAVGLHPVCTSILTGNPPSLLIRGTTMKRTIIYGFILLLSVFMMFENVCAYQAPPKNIDIVIQNKGDTIVYGDILINSKENVGMAHYETVNGRIMEAYPQLLSSQLASYHQGGWISYSLYYDYSNGSMAFLTQSDGYGGTQNFLVFAQGQNNQFSEAKIVLLDREGNIVRISEPFKTLNAKAVYFDCASGKISISTYRPDDPVLDVMESILFSLGVLWVMINLFIQLILAVRLGVRPIAAVMGFGLLLQSVMLVIVDTFFSGQILPTFLCFLLAAAAEAGCLFLIRMRCGKIKILMLSFSSYVFVYVLKLIFHVAAGV